MRYFDKSVYNGEVARNVVMLEYEFPQDFISNSRRLIDIKTGLPLYAQSGSDNGGNNPFMSGMRADNSQEMTVISKNTMIDGNVRSFADMKIDGNIKGNVETTKNITINGKVVGDLTCDKSTH